MRIYAIFLNTFREAVRNKILYSLVLFAFLLLGISAFFGSVTIGQQEQVIKDFGLVLCTFFGVLMTIVIGVTLLHKELKQKTVYNILSKPVPRWEFIVGKYFGLTVTVSLLVILMGMALMVFASCFEHRVDYRMGYGILFCLFEIAVVASIVIFFSSMAVTTTLTGLFTLGAFLAGHSISYLLAFASDASAAPMVRTMVHGVSWILPNLSLFNVNQVILYGGEISGSELGQAMLYSVSYSTVMLVLASLVFAKRELV